MRAEAAAAEQSDAAPAVLEVRRVGHRFGGLRVLEDVAFEVGCGRIVGLIGPNGAGKSTLFNIVSGFLRPDRGAIVFDGADVTALPVRARSRRGLIRTFQTPKVFGHLSVLENLMVGRHCHGRTGVLQNLFGTSASRAEWAAAREAAAGVCAQYDLAGLEDAPAGRLPSGRQRMVELARAALAQPRLLMLDEPSSGLNAHEIDVLARALQRLNSEGVTVLLVSHDMDLVAIASTVHVLCFGEIIASGPMTSIRQDRRVREAYLGT